MEYKGISIFPGIVAGKVYIYQDPTLLVQRENIQPEEVEEALHRYDDCREAIRNDLESISRDIVSQPEQAEIFSAHIHILFDEDMDRDIRNMIKAELVSPEWAIETVYGRYEALLESSGNPLTMERVADLRDVRTRLVRSCARQESASRIEPSDPAIIVARELSPSEAVALDKEKTLAIITEAGGPTSHSAILARSRGIPTVFGVGGIMRHIENEQQIIVDGEKGVVTLQPPREQKEAAKRAMAEEKQRRSARQKEVEQEAVTVDGHRVQVKLNILSADADIPEVSAYVDGIGLFRTEFLYMKKGEMPSEEEQFNAYKQALTHMGERPVVLRTLDAGGDKRVHSLNINREENPSLGNRGLRLCLQHDMLFITQLRAALRASLYGNLWLMLPMVSRLEDFTAAHAMLDKARTQLDEEGIPYSSEIKTGIMIEIPSIALLADKVAARVDFASIGTNDLIQYMCAADRDNVSVSGYYQPCHPAVLRMIKYAAEQFEKAGKPLAVCGEMGSDAIMTETLLGCGIRSLSVVPGAVADIKEQIRALSIKEARRVADAVCDMTSAQEVQEYLRGRYRKEKEV